MIKKNTIPEDFYDLEIFNEWALETRMARFQKRVKSTMGEITAFYNAMVPRMDKVVAYLDSKPLNALSEADRNLMSMALSLVEVSRSVELWQAPDNGSFDADRVYISL
jgi:proteasome lid subunit RPN8/RPN11